MKYRVLSSSATHVFWYSFLQSFSLSVMLSSLECKTCQSLTNFLYFLLFLIITICIQIDCHLRQSWILRNICSSYWVLVLSDFTTLHQLLFGIKLFETSSFFVILFCIVPPHIAVYNTMLRYLTPHHSIFHFAALLFAEQCNTTVH